MKKHILYFLLLAIVVSIGCQKELSFEGSNEPAKGTLQADISGDCLPKTVNGAYVASTALVPGTNTITVDVNVARTGSYTVYTDTVNGYYFRGTGTFTTLGINTVTLRGNGTPFAAGVNNFVVAFDSTFCDIQVTVLPAGTGPAVFTLVSGGTPANCANAVVSGTYVKDGALGASNYVDISVNVTQTGTYTIKATGGGMTFENTGAFLTAGNQTVRLQGSGTPTTVNANTITFLAPFASCSFTVNVTTPVAGTLGGAPGACTPATVNNTPVIKQGVALSAANTVLVQINTPTAGPYSVSTDTQAGISFSGSGTSVAGIQTITLQNNGSTPTASGIQTFTVTFGSSTCTFTINIAPAATNGACVPDCTTAVVNGLYEVNLQLNCSNTIDIDVNVTALGPITITTTPVNGMTFSYTGTFTALGTQTITLVGSGTPGNTPTTSNITMPGSSPICTVPVTVNPPFGPIDWKFTVTNPAPNMTYGGQDDGGQLDNPSPVGVGILFTYFGSNSDGSDGFSFGLNDFNGTINAGEDYVTTANPLTTNAAAFEYDTPTPSSCADVYKADPTVTGVTMTFHVNTHDVVNHVITGIFSGTAKNTAGQIITITNGTFKGTY